MDTKTQKKTKNSSAQDMIGGEKMKKNLLAILAALVALLVCASIFVACTEEGTGEETGGGINIEETDDEGNVIDSGDEIGTGNQTADKIGDPGAYQYTECDQTVYVNNPDSAVTLRSEDYKALGSIAHGTELRRIGLSTDEANYWSKVIHNEKTYYVATKFLTTIKNADEGFVEIEKTVIVNDQTGSLKIRNLPTFDGSQIIGFAIAGTEYKVVAENAETGWYKIEFVPYGATEATFGYIKSGADNFVKQKDADNKTEKDTTADTTQDTGDADENGGSGK